MPWKALMSRPMVPRSRRISRRRPSIGLFLSALVLVQPVAKTARAAAPPGPACLVVTSEARYGGYGYNHLVRIANSCEEAVLCTVSTDVNPAPEQVTVPPNEAREVVTFRGSPAREFVPLVRCQAI
jgi:hypothetical protein